MSTKECDERFNRINFFLKNVKTTHTYMNAFTLILGMYPLAPITTNDKKKLIKYLCVASNVLSKINCIERF